MIFVLCFSGCMDRQITSRGGTDISVARMDAFITAQMDSLNMPGISLAIINNGKVVYRYAGGVANIDKGSLVDEQSVFEAASLSKPVFAYFVMRMVDKGILDLDTPLYHYLPYPDIEHDERYKLITARMVLTHQTGFPNWRYIEKADSSLHVNYGDLYLKFIPGTQFAYSGEGFHYLTKVVAHLNGKDIQTLEPIFQEEIARPLHLEHFYFSGNTYITAHKVSGHEDGKVVDKKWPIAFPEQDSTWFGAAGGLHTDVESYAGFLIALMNDNGLSKKSIGEIFSTQIKLPETNELVTEGGYSAWGLGIAIMDTPSGPLYLHGGNNGDFQAGFAMDKDKKWGFVFFTNCDKGNEFDKRLQQFLLR